ncbi:hypothetical protein D9M71_490580 [compost metagenome]
MIYPTIVYKCPGNHQCHGGTYDLLGIGDDIELSMALSSGWFLTLPEAIAGVANEVEDISAPTREEMAIKAVELGIKFDGRTTDKALAEKIEAALAERSE